MPTSNVVAGNWEDWKRRQHGGLLACNDRRWELIGCRGSWRVDDGQSSRPAAVAGGGGGRVWTLGVVGLGLQNSVILMMFKKKNSIEPTSSQGTGLFVRFTCWTTGSSDLTLVQSHSDPIDWTRPER